MAGAGFDRRSSVRVDVHLAVHIARRAETIHTTVASDLSGGGMFIHELLPYETGVRLHVSFMVAGMERLFACDAVVMHARSEFREGFPNSPIGNGLSFIDLAADDREALNRLVQQRSA
jgi:hypothetical protein